MRIASLPIVRAGMFGAVIHLFPRLPSSIAIMAVAPIASFGIAGPDLVAVPGMADRVRGIVTGIECSDALLEGMRAFRGSPARVALDHLRAEGLPALPMATTGVGLSTVVTDLGFSWLPGMPLRWRRFSAR